MPRITIARLMLLTAVVAVGLALIRSNIRVVPLVVWCGFQSGFGWVVWKIMRPRRERIAVIAGSTYLAVIILAGVFAALSGTNFWLWIMILLLIVEPILCGSALALLTPAPAGNANRGLSREFMDFLAIVVPAICLAVVTLTVILYFVVVILRAPT